jgi:phosphoenolpyruvate carboxykinase (ATP)
MPPVSKLSPEQAMYHFLSGYTAKVAGTERGIKEPQATFSTCFGAPFMVLQPSVYANLLKEKLNKHKAQCWLVNTGWGGGPFGVGKRISIAHTRAIINSILSGKLKNVPTSPDAVFGLQIPKSCEGVPTEILTPRNTWSSPADYDAKARDLAKRFEKNFETFSSTVPDAVCASGPRAS